MYLIKYRGHSPSDNNTKLAFLYLLSLDCWDDNVFLEKEETSVDIRTVIENSLEGGYLELLRII
jgi:hypothetical protein